MIKRPPTLYCTVLYCTVLYCTALYCTVLYCTVPVQGAGGLLAGEEESVAGHQTEVPPVSEHPELCHHLGPRLCWGDPAATLRNIYSIYNIYKISKFIFMSVR